MNNFIPGIQFLAHRVPVKKLYSGNKIIGDLKNGEIGIIFVFLEQIRAVLGVFRVLASLPIFLQLVCVLEIVFLEENNGRSQKRRN